MSTQLGHMAAAAGALANLKMEGFHSAARASMTEEQPTQCVGGMVHSYCHAPLVV